MKEKKYNHLSLGERQAVHTMKHQGYSDSEIGRFLGRHRTTISRELKRNRLSYGMRGKLKPLDSARLSHDKALRRRSDCKRGRRSGIKFALVKEQIVELLEVRLYSPEDIADKISGKDFSVSGKTIRRWIERESPTLRKSLPQRGKKKRNRLTKRKSRKGRSIHSRPRIVSQRKRVGDFEADAVVCSQSREAIISLRERKLRRRWFTKVENLKAQTVKKALIRLFREIPPEMVKTCTFDNGSEFSEFRMLEKAFHLEAFFADPYCSWQKGAVEHQNMELRRYIPKGTDLSTISEEELKRYQFYLNDKPMDCLGKKTALEVWSEELDSLKIAA